MIASNVANEEEEYDFENMDDVERFIKEVVKPYYDEIVADGGQPQFLACGMPILTGLHRLMENRVEKMSPIAPMPGPVKEGNLMLEWSGAEDASWVML